MMIIASILVSLVFVIGALTIYVIGAYVEHKGYMRGIDEAERIIWEVQDEGRENMRNM